MKHWLLLVTAVACLWGCSDNPSQTTTSAASSGNTSSSSSSSSSGGGNGGAGGSQPVPLVLCIDDRNALPMPPSGKLPCEYIPPGLALPE